MDMSNFLIELIINNTELNYRRDDLRIDGDTVILEVLKVLAKEKYQERFKELQEKETNKEDLT